MVFHKVIEDGCATCADCKGGESKMFVLMSSHDVTEDTGKFRAAKAALCLLCHS